MAPATLLDQVQSLCQDRNARFDAPSQVKRDGPWSTRASGQGGPPDAPKAWTSVGNGDDPDAALTDLKAKLEARPPLTDGHETCPTCGQDLPR